MILKELSMGLEFGSTRIKAVLIDIKGQILAQGFYEWENKYVNGIWTYDLDLVFIGMKECFKGLKKDFENKYNIKLTTLGSICISGMMHGYLVFDKNLKQLKEFRTWRNTITSEASTILTKELNYKIPQRWSIAHLYKQILENSSEVNDIDFMTTLSGYIHYLLTNEKVIGVGEASGMFPINKNTLDYDKEMIDKFNLLIKDKANLKIENILPKVLVAGINAGYLTKEGALLLDETNELESGIPFAAPEGDMGTGMVATNSLRENTGNASIGTSSNLTITTGKNVKIYDEIDEIMSPSGTLAQLIHVNNGTSDINAWVDLFMDLFRITGIKIDRGELFSKLFISTKQESTGAKGITHYDYLSGEPIAKINEGRPLFIREPDSKLDIPNFMLSNIYSLLSTIRMGLEILTLNENIKIDKIYGHGGFFKTKGVGDYYLSAATDATVLTLESASEGGPYGAALLASYFLNKDNSETLEDYLDNKIYKNMAKTEVMATDYDKKLFNEYYESFKKYLEVERTSIKC